MKRSKLFLILITTFCLAIITACGGETSHTHRYGEWTFTTTPTLTEKGVAEKVCEECGRKVSDVEVPNLADSNFWTVSHTVLPTCATKGTDTYTSVYGTVDVTVDEVEHEYGEWTITVDPTKEATGKAAHKCVYGETKEEEIPSLSDDVWSLAKTIDATCTEGAKEVYTSVYGEVTITVADALGHTFGEWTLTKDATLTEKGTAERVCHCGEKETVEVPELTDTTVWTIVEKVEATCTKDGSATYKSVYGTVVIILKSSGHTFGAWTITSDPTLTEKGTAERTCECGEKETVEVPELTDTTVWEITEEVDPTYNEAGSATYKSVYGTVEITLPKKVAPYDNKTYSNFVIDADDDNYGYINGKLRIETTWGTATISLNESGQGTGAAFPFRGLNIYTMLDALTGKIEIKQVPYKTDENEETYLDYNDATTYTAYVDFATGIVVRTYRASFNNIIVLTPFTTNTKDVVASASSWDNAIAVDYTHGDEVTHIFVYKNVVYFGVTFVDESGNEISADKCYNAPYLYVLDKDGKLIEGFGFNGEKEVVLDGLEGTYKNGDDTLVISGYKTVLYNGVSGTYEIIDNVLAIYVNDTYYEVQLNKENNTYTITKPMVTIKFNCGEYAEIEDAVVNKNIKYTLPNPTSTDKLFTGWYLDEALTQAVDEEFIPTKDVTLYAGWKTKVVIKLENVLDGDATEVTLAEGEKISSVLPKYTIDKVNNRKFVGWYVDENFETTLTEDYEVIAEDTNTVIYAKWIDLPVYYGTYTGTEIWGKTSGGSAKVTLSIDENGKISGKYNGYVVGYDKETQKISWKESLTSSTVYGLWYDEATKVLATQYSSKNEIGTDYFIFSKNAPELPVVSHFGLNCNKPNTTLTGYYARFVEIKTETSSVNIFIYGDHIYSNVSVKTTLGEELTPSTLKNASKMVVRDADGNVIIGLAAVAKSSSEKGTTFNELGSTIVLDSYFGTYMFEGKEVILDGTGIISYDGKLGTYTLAATEQYGFDVYLNDNTEYYQLTLNGSNCTLVKPMVLVTFVVGDGHTEIEAKSYNMNIATTLPDATEENYVFNGWYFDAELTKAVPTSFVPTENITLYAKHSAPADLTICYNNGEDQDVIRYSIGDKVTVANPTYKKHRFEGWYTTAEFTEGTEWKSGTVINESLTIYAKWSVAPIYNERYLPVEITGKSQNGSTSSVYARTSAILDIDPDGVASCESYPFRGGITVTDYNEAEGTLTFKTPSIIYKGYIDQRTGIIILTKDSGDKAVFGEVMMLVPTAAEKGDDIKNDYFSTSYWNSGLTRAIGYSNGTTGITVFVMNGKVYFDISFRDTDGLIVSGKDAYKTKTLFVYDRSNNLISKFGHNGTTLVALDGFEGMYKNDVNVIELDGINEITLNGVKGTYSLATDKAYTLDVYVENVYYEVTLDKDTYSYTINKPMVEITLTTEISSVNSLVVNKNIEITLPVLTDENNIFRGWYYDDKFTKAVGTTLVPTDSTTLYAKWDQAVYVTFVMGNTLENVVVQYGVGDTPILLAPSFTNGKAFDGWFTDQELTATYKAEALTASITLYAKWIDANPLYGSYLGFEAYGRSLTSISIYGGKTLKVDALGKATGTQSGTISEYNEATGMFVLVNGTNKYAGYFDKENGIVIINYSKVGTDGVLSLGDDQYIYFANRGNVTFNKDESGNLDSGKARIVYATFKEGALDGAYVFVYNNKIYFNVTFTSNGNKIKGSQVGSSENVTIYDSSNNLIATFNNGTLVE